MLRSVFETSSYRLRKLGPANAAGGSSERQITEREYKELSVGVNRLGADAGNDIHLDARGVSRFHAVIHCRPEGCELEDLESKNGSKINGRAVRQSPLRPGDVVALGASHWVLEEVQAGDLELGLELGPSRGLDTTVLGSSSQLGPGAHGDGLPLSLLAALLGRLRRCPHPDLEGALVEIARHLGITTACLVEWPKDGPARVLAAVGQLSERIDRNWLAELQPLTGDPRFGFRSFPDAGNGDLVVVAHLTEPLPGTAGPAIGILQNSEQSSRWAVVTVLAGFLLLLEGVEETASGPNVHTRESDQGRRPPLPDDIVAGTSGPMAGVYAQLMQVAGDPVPVMILGETGVGKEHLARAIHESSVRKEKPFVALNCAAIPGELLEAELFGIGRGVATGVQARPGKIRQANGGTLFLDEIGDMPLALQAKLLRVLQEGEVSPVGERPVSVDVRWVAATHADLPSYMEQKAFRRDLYYRLAGYVLKVPALRERKEDVPVLLGHFLRLYSHNANRRIRGVTVRALECAASHPWPGNIRELQHVARRLVYLCPSNQAVDSSMVDEAIDQMPATLPQSKEVFVLGRDGLDDHLVEIERRYLLEALERSEGNQSKAARLLQISRSSLARRMDRLEIPKRSL